MVAPAWAQQKQGELITKAIPHSGERIPAVGLGTAVNFNTADAETERKASEVVLALVAGGGRLATLFVRDLLCRRRYFFRRRR